MAALPLETEVLVPNGVYASQIMITTQIVDGKKRTSAQIQLTAARVDNPDTPEETWTPTGQGGFLSIPDLLNLEPDLKPLAPSVKAVFANILQLIATANRIRKLL